MRFGLTLLLTLLVSGAAKAQTNSNADAVFKGYLSAFCVQNGNTAYFVNGLSDSSVAYLWGQAYMITGVEDAYERNPTPANQQLVTNLLNTFISDNGSDYSGDIWNDDLAWCCIAMIRGYIITGNTTFLNVATTNWNTVWNRGWDNTVGGGIWENQDKYTKAALSNDPMIIAGMFIYQCTRDNSYPSKCEQIYSWVRANLLNTSTGVVNEAITSSGALQASDNAYNAGAFVNAANALYQTVGGSQYYNDAALVANHLKNNFNPISSTGGSSYADQAVRGVSIFARDNNLWSTYLPWLTSQCNAAWNNRRTDYNITWNNWTQATPTDNTKVFAMDCLSSMVVQMVTELDQKVGTHMIVCQLNGYVVDCGSSTAQSAGIEQWSSNGGLAQKWRFTQNSDTSWNIKSVYSGLLLDNPGGSNTNGTQMIQYSENYGSNQKWWVDQQSDGTYKIWNQASSLALDNGSVTQNGSKIIEWSWNGSGNPQQRWTFR